MSATWCYLVPKILPRRCSLFAVFAAKGVVEVPHQLPVAILALWYKEQTKNQLSKTPNLQIPPSVNMPATANGKDLATFGTVIPDAPKPWRLDTPKGLHIFDGAISKKTRDGVWAFFHPKNGGREGEDTSMRKPREDEFPWYQRFRRFLNTAHYNAWHSGKFIGEDGQAEFAAKYPELYVMATEAIQTVRQEEEAGESMADVPAWGNFQPESVAVMRHCPGWGLGTHYDNSHDEGVGMVLMLSLSSDDCVPRTFQFTDPPNGRKCPVKTKDCQAIVFGGECYDYWMHESLHNKKQSGETISMTIRLAGVCGSTMRNAAGDKIPGSAYRPAGGGQYSTGAPAAKKVAHARIAAKRAAWLAAAAPY